MKKIFLAITLIFSITSNTIAQESKTYYEKITGSGTANGGEYNYEATLEAKIYNSGLGGIAVKFGIGEYKITSFKYKEEFYYKTDEGFPIEINNIQSDLIDGYLNIKSATYHYSVADQKFSMLGIRKGHLDNVELNNENIKSIKNYNNGGKVSFDDFYLEFFGKLKNTYFEQLAKIASSYDILKRKEKNDNYLAEQKEKAQEKLKEIEIAQERDRKAREREALKSENYYKTSPNSIKTGGYPLTGYQKAQQDINRVNASYDKFEKAISDFKNKSYQRYKESQKEYPTIEEQIAELDKVTAEKNRRMEETSLFFNLQSSLSDLEENISDVSLENLKGIDTGNIYLKMVQLSRKKGYPTISDYTRKENSYGFKTNNPPIYNVYHTSIAVIPISLINNHPYLYNLYLSEIRAKKRTDEFYNFDVKFIKFKDVSILNKYWNLIVENYDTDPLLDFKLDNTKFPMQSFESYVSENIDVERDYLKKVADKKKSNADNKKKTDEIFKNSKSYKKVYFNYKPYYLVEFHDKKNGLIDESGNFLIDKIEYSIQHLGNGYFEIIVEEGEKPNGENLPILIRKSILYNLNEKDYSDPLFILDHQTELKYLTLLDDKTKKKGFIYKKNFSVVYPKYDQIEGYGTYDNLYVMNNGLHGVVNSLGKEIVPIKYAAIQENQIKESLAFGSIEVTHYWCRTVEDYKIAHKFDETGKYLGRWKLHKSWRYIKKLKN